MRVKIVDVPVRQNIELFLEILRRAKEKLPKNEIPSEKIFSAWLNRETGQLVFNMRESLDLTKDEWKPVEISYSFDPQKGEIFFFIEESKSSIQGFSWGDLAPSAYLMMREMMLVLNEICHKLKGPSDLDTKMAVLTKVNIDFSASHPDQNILMRAWHPVDRFEAETLLMDKPVGSYLFRRDPFCEILEEELREVHEKEILCFTLSYSQPNSIITDCTLVHCYGKWQSYNDDPSLEQPSFEAFTELLDQWEGQLKYPLFRF